MAGQQEQRCQQTVTARALQPAREERRAAKGQLALVARLLRRLSRERHCSRLFGCSSASALSAVAALLELRVQEVQLAQALERARLGAAAAQERASRRLQVLQSSQALQEQLPALQALLAAQEQQAQLRRDSPRQLVASILPLRLVRAMALTAQALRAQQALRAIPPQALLGLLEPEEQEEKRVHRESVASPVARSLAVAAAQQERIQQLVRQKAQRALSLPARSTE